MIRPLVCRTENFNSVVVVWVNFCNMPRNVWRKDEHRQTPKSQAVPAFDRFPRTVGKEWMWMFNQNSETESKQASIISWIKTKLDWKILWQNFETRWKILFPFSVSSTQHNTSCFLRWMFCEFASCIPRKARHRVLLFPFYSHLFRLTNCKKTNSISQLARKQKTEEKKHINRSKMH